MPTYVNMWMVNVTYLNMMHVCICSQTHNNVMSHACQPCICSALHQLLWLTWSDIPRKAPLSTIIVRRSKFDELGLREKLHFKVRKVLAGAIVKTVPAAHGNSSVGTILKDESWNHNMFWWTYCELRRVSKFSNEHVIRFWSDFVLSFWFSADSFHGRPSVEAS